jgi:hypothetical protein
VVTLSKTTAEIGQLVKAFITISNSGGSPVDVTSIFPTVKPVSGVEGMCPAVTGIPALGPGLNKTVPAGGSLVLSFDVAFFMGSSQTGQATQWPYYYVDADLETDDGSKVNTTAARIPVITNPNLVQSGRLQFNQFEASGLLPLI